MPVSDAFVQKFAEAIAHAEGFYAPIEIDKGPNIPQRCHNPGDLTEDGVNGDVGYGTARSAGYGAANITIYSCDDDGWVALRRKVRRILDGASMAYPTYMSVDALGLKYSCSTVWAKNVADYLGVSTSTKIIDLADSNQGPTLV
jgi:hypothetical protein